MVKKVIVLIFIAQSLSLSVFSQANDTIQVVQDTTESLIATQLGAEDKVESQTTDTVIWVEDKKLTLDKSKDKVLMNTEPFKPNPTKAVLYSAIFPGLGQIYNRKYWKLPIVYGGALGLVYAITWNGRMYSDYTTAYKAIMSPDYLEKQSDYMNVFRGNIKDPADWTASDLQIARDAIRRRRDFNRRNRDLSIIAAVALYALCMVDSYVDAQLYDFDMSPDLSFRVEPKVGLDNFSQMSVGLQCSVKF